MFKKPKIFLSVVLLSAIAAIAGFYIFYINTLEAQTGTDKTLTVSKSGPAPGDVEIFDLTNGLIDCGTTCSADYPYNTEVTLTALENAYTQFDGWSGSGCTGTGDCTITMSATGNVTANFSLLPQSLSVTPTGLGTGTITSSPDGIDCGITCDADFSFGSTVTLTATPDADSQFIQWSGDCVGAGPGGSNPGTCAVTLDQPRAVSAEFQPKITDTPTNPDLSGWAWSSTIGWLSFNCLDQNVCGQSDYRVEIDPITGALNGWAWSPVVGWVQFDAQPDLITGLYPADPQTPATMDINTGIFSGWARILSYENQPSQARQNGPAFAFTPPQKNKTRAQINTFNFDALIHFFKNIIGDNFNLISPGKIFAQTTGFGDGWLKIVSGPLAATLGIPEARRQNDELRGWVWGGEPIGWLNFYNVSMPSPTCSFNSDKTNVSPNEAVALNWTCDFSVSCSLNENLGDVDPVSGSTADTPTKKVTVYQLTCTGLGTTKSWSVKVRQFESPRKEIRPR